MKKLIITEEIDKILASICDAALKAGGMQIFPLIQRLSSEILIEEVKDDIIH